MIERRETEIGRGRQADRQTAKPNRICWWQIISSILGVLSYEITMGYLGGNTQQRIYRLDEDLENPFFQKDLEMHININAMGAAEITKGNGRMKREKRSKRKGG